VHEAKFDGYRVQLQKSAGGVSLLSRNGVDFKTRWEALAASAAEIPARSVILDGEVVASNAKGVPQFYALHTRSAGAEAIHFWALDLLHLNGADLRSLPLVDRRCRLETLMRRVDAPALMLSETFEDAPRLLAACEANGLEGVVSKRATSPYVSGATRSWIKVKCASWRAANRERHRLFGDR
jgi:bifunctional non-homologous end joining protein LigD